MTDKKPASVTTYREPLKAPVTAPYPQGSRAAEIAAKTKEEQVVLYFQAVDEVVKERDRHGTTCTELGMICQALGFDIQKVDEVIPAIKALQQGKEDAEKVLVLIGEKAVVDFDDPTVGQVDAVVKDREKYKDWVCAILGNKDAIKLKEAYLDQTERYVALQQEADRLKLWIADLQSGQFVNCVYCGHRYGPNKDTPVAMADVLKAHIAECPQHPLSLLKKALFRLVETKKLKEASGKTPEYEKARQEAWKLAEEALALVNLPIKSCYDKTGRKDWQETGWQPQ